MYFSKLNLNFPGSSQVNKIRTSFQDSLKTLAIILFNAYIIFWTSVLLYGTFNYYYLPVAHQVNQVYFHFSVCDNGVGICSFPKANLSLVKPESQQEVFKRGQYYKIVLDMDLPESDFNKKIGMFMMEMKLYNKEGKTVHSSVRSGSLLYKSMLLETLETLSFAPFYLFGYFSQKQTVQVEFFPNFLEYTYDRTVGVAIEIQSHQIQMYMATLNILSQFSGIRYFLYYWPMTSAIIGISWIFTFLSFVVLLSWYQFHERKSEGREEITLASIDMEWKRQDDSKHGKALLSPDEMTHKDFETLGALPEGHESTDDTLLLSASSSPVQDPELRYRKTTTQK